MNYIVGIGEILWDMLPEGKQLGGAPANFAFHASQAGMQSDLTASGLKLTICLSNSTLTTS